MEENRDKPNDFDKKPQILRQEVIVVYTQDSDGQQDTEYEDGQFLTIRSENCGGGDYFIIETNRWAFDNIDELVDTLKQFKEKYDNFVS